MFNIKEMALIISESQVNKRVNLYPVGVEADHALDKQAPGKSSERIQQNLITDSFFEFLAGLHADNMEWYRLRLIQEAKDVKKRG